MATSSPLGLSVTRLSARRSALLAAALSVALLVGPLLALGQEPKAEAPQPEVEEPKVIPAAEVAVRAQEVQVLLGEIGARAEPSAALVAIVEELPSVQERTAERAPVALERIASEPSETILFNIESEWLGLNERLGAWLKTLSQRLETLEGDHALLAGLEDRWQETLKAAKAEGLPAPLLQRIRTQRDAIRSTQGAVDKRRKEVLTLQDEVAEQTSTLSEVLSQVAKARQQLRMGLLTFDSPPLWTALAQDRPEGESPVTLRSEWADAFQLIQTYMRERVPKIVLYGALSVLIFIVISLLRAPAARWSEQDEEFALSAKILARPGGAALVFALMGIPLFTSAPPLAKGIAALLLVAPVLWLLTPILDREMRRGLYGLVLWYVVSWARGFLVLEPLSVRIVMLLEELAVISVLVWLLRPARLAKLEEPSSLLQVVGVGVRLTVLALVVAAVSNVLGNTSLAALLTDATLASAYVGFLLFAVERVLAGSYAGLLHTQLASSLRVVRLHGALLRRRGVRLIRFAAIALWIFLVLRFFHVRDEIIAGISIALSTPWSIGNLELALGDFVAFGVMIWLSFLLSRFVRFTLEEEMLPRTSLPRGVPFAVSALARYSVLLLGFLIAVAAAGIDMSRITLIIGALGVGIGIGLQGVVNNIVSGLILLFERPIQVGDTVQLADTLGEVRRIGIRSSTLRTFDGAEVVIPNARFVSDEFVNWTLSDRNRRIEIPVGVAYGSDPEQVIALLLDVANSHPDIMSSPEPSALFLRFGDSSLDFQLRAWTGRSEAWREVSSQIAVAINRALGEAGIVIPFPQRDLHLRSVDPELQKKGGGE